MSETSDEAGFSELASEATGRRPEDVNSRPRV
jgi:hypothetical protein